MQQLCLFQPSFISHLFYISAVLFCLFFFTFDNFSGTHVCMCVQVGTPLITMAKQQAPKWKK